MSITGEKGFAFSLDLALAFITMLMMVLIITGRISSRAETMEEETSRLELERNAIFLVDSMVKNRCEENPLLGSASFDSEKKRVMQNHIDYELLKNAKPVEGEILISRLSITEGREEIIFQEKEGKNCIALERAVEIGGKAAKLEVVACEKRILPEP